MYFCFNTNGFTCLSYSDASGNPVTQQVQSVAVTDASGNPVTGIIYKIWLISAM